MRPLFSLKLPLLYLYCSKYYSLGLMPSLTSAFEMRRGGTAHGRYLGLVTSCTGGGNSPKAKESYLGTEVREGERPQSSRKMHACVIQTIAGLYRVVLYRDSCEESLKFPLSCWYHGCDRQWRAGTRLPWAASATGCSRENHRVI